MAAYHAVAGAFLLLVYISASQATPGYADLLTPANFALLIPLGLICWVVIGLVAWHWTRPLPLPERN
jgi:hypothetical protein